VRPGACVISVGACRPEQREMDPALVARARLYVDSRAGAFEESGDVVLGIREGLFAQSHIVAELGEVVAGAARGRETDDEVTIFKSLGMAVEDMAAAALVYARAKAAGRGVQLA
jgi:alanine dehydrogenase